MHDPFTAKLTIGHKPDCVFAEKFRSYPNTFNLHLMKNALPWILLTVVALAWAGTLLLNPESKTRMTSVLPVHTASLTEDEAWAKFEEAELLAQLKESGRYYLPFLDKSTLSTGIYRLPEGATDRQQPHKMDEIYYALSGKAQFEVNGETMAVQPGTILFVAANAEHRFFDIEEDLELLVFFSKAGMKD